MPTYVVTDPASGKTLRLTGDSPPTEAELEAIFRTVEQQTTTRSEGVLERFMEFLGPTPVEAGTRVVGTALGLASGGAGLMPLVTAASGRGARGVGRVIAEHPVETGALAGGTALGLATGGAGLLPAMAAAGLGGAGGAGYGLAAQQLRDADTAPAPTVGGNVRTMLAHGAMQAGAEGAGQVITKGLPKAARAVYRGYLKPSLAKHQIAKADTVVQTALEEALPITKGGAAKAQRVIGELRREVDDVLTTSRGTVDLHQIAERVRAFAKQRYFKPGVDLSDYRMALDVANRLDQHPVLGLPPGARPTRVDVPLAAANEAKRGLYTSIKETGFGTPQGAKKSTEKFAAHELKTALEGAAPSIAPLNAREAKLIDAARAIMHATNREANQQKLYGAKTITSAALGGAGYGLGVGGPAALAGAVSSRALLHPAVASRVALAANQIATGLGVSTATALRLAMYVMAEDIASQ